MGLREALIVGEDAATMGYQLTREKKFFGKYYLWHDALPIIIGDLTMVKRFLITDPATRAEMEYRVNADLLADSITDPATRAEMENEKKAEIAARITDPATRAAFLALITDPARRAETEDREQVEIGAHPEDGIPIDDREAMVAFLRKGYMDGTLKPPPPSLPMRDSSVDGVSLPDRPVAGWSGCPACGGELVIVQGAGECIGCRRIWCDPDRKPTLDDQGKLVGTELGYPMSPTEFRVFLRFPPPEGLPLPSD